MDALRTRRPVAYACARGGGRGTRFLSHIRKALVSVWIVARCNFPKAFGRASRIGLSFCMDPNHAPCT